MASSLAEKPWTGCSLLLLLAHAYKYFRRPIDANISTPPEARNVLAAKGKEGIEFRGRSKSKSKEQRARKGAQGDHWPETVTCAHAVLCRKVNSSKLDT
jgi:hypothetical protein